MYVAECLDIGTVDQGATIEEAINNLKEATKLYLEECPNIESNPLKKNSDISEKEQWLWKNKQALNSVLKGIEEAKQGQGKSLGDFSQYADLEIED